MACPLHVSYKTQVKHALNFQEIYTSTLQHGGLKCKWRETLGDNLRRITISHPMWDECFVPIPAWDEGGLVVQCGWVRVIHEIKTLEKFARPWP